MCVDSVDDSACGNNSLGVNKLTKAWSQEWGVHRHTGCVEKHLRPLCGSQRGLLRGERL